MPTFFNPKNSSGRVCLAVVLLGVLFFAACTQPFSLYQKLYGPSPLTISPTSAVLQINDSIPIVTSGGVPPYTYSVISGGGSFTGNIYTAPPVATPVVNIQVTDNEGTIIGATYTVNATGISVGISPSSQTIFTGGTIDFSPFGGSGPFEFALTTDDSGGSVNLTTGFYTAGSDSGTDEITVTDTLDLSTSVATITVQPKPFDISPQTITVYVNQSIDFSAIGGDGTFSYALGLQGSAPTLTGGTSHYTAGPVPGTDTVILTDSYDGRTRTATVTVVNIAVTTNVDYEALPITIDSPGNLLAGTNFDAHFSIRNNGTANGSQPVSWTVFASTDTVIGGTDDRIAASGSIAGGITALSTAPVLFTGTWPTDANSYYLLVEVYAPDDLDPSDNRNQSAGSTQIYNPLKISPSVASVYAGQVIDFLVEGGTGNYTYNFSATGSGSPVVGAGAIYTAGTIAGTDILQVTDTTYPVWPATSATITISAVSPPPVGDVDYYVFSPPAGGAVLQGAAVSANFTIRNQGTDAGSANVSWWAYISSDKFYSAGDTLIDSDNVGALGAGVTSGLITIDSGTWSSVGSWYLLIRLQASDEVNTANNITASSGVYTVTSVAPTSPDYKVNSVSMYAPFTTTGSSVEESFTIQNMGSNGIQNVTWTAYASLDSIPSIGEEIGTGIFGPLTAGQTLNGISLLGATWPAAQGDYYLIVKASATDEIVTGDYGVSAGRFTISDPPDYIIESVTYPSEAQGGTAITGNFTIRNSGSGNGKKNILWETYLSYDTGLSADDFLLGSKEIGPLVAGGTRLVPASDLSVVNWPSYGRCYFLIRLTSADDGNDMNNSYVSPVKELYILDAEGPVPSGTANDGSGPSTGAIPNTQNVGTLRLGQTLVIRGWLDKSGVGGWDTYKITVGSGISIVSTYATWVAVDDIGGLYIWDELNYEFYTTNTFNGREPAAGYYSVAGWVPPEIGYVGLDSYRNVTVGNEYPYTLYILGRE